MIIEFGSRRCAVQVSGGAGEAGREPVVFVHGFPLCGLMWASAAAALADGWTCIVPDLCGFGASDAVPDASMALYADDVAAILTAVGRGRPAVVVGLSMGGMIAFEMFRRHRKLIRALVLCDTRAAAETAEGVVRREAVAKEVQARGSVAAADAMIGNLLSPSVPAVVREHWRGVMAIQPAAGVAAGARALASRPDSRKTLGEIDVPTMMVCGSDDALTPPAGMREMAGEMVRVPGGVRFEEMSGAGHVPPVECPDRFAAVLKSFVSGLAPVRV